MMITPQNILRHELCGLTATIETNDTQHTGEVAGETRDTLTLKTSKGMKTFPKKTINIRLTLPEKTIVEVDGNLLTGRPQDRVKKKIRIKY